MPASPKQSAIHALMRAAFDCPSRIDHEAFWDYQNNVMEPLRESIRIEAAREARECVGTGPTTTPARDGISDTGTARRAGRFGAIAA